MDDETEEQPFTATFRLTERGFEVYEFKDRYGQPCSLQSSSLATEAAIWLGRDDGDGNADRMHLTIEQAAWLAQRLIDFIRDGHLREPGS